MVKLNDVIDVLEIYIGDAEGSCQFHFNLKTEEFIYSMIGIDDSGEDLYADEEVYLPFYHDIYSSQIIVAFIESIDNTETQNRMFHIFEGTGKYRRIKEYFHVSGLIDHYYSFKYDYLKVEAIKWCEEHDIPYIDQ